MKPDTKKLLVPGAVCAVLSAGAYFLKYHLAGYGFSALVLLCMVCVILFYMGMYLLYPHAPAAVAWVRRIFTACLVLGLSVCLVTEAFIIKASFGGTKAEQDSCEYIVVLGAKVRDDGPSRSLWDRILKASDFLLTHPGTVAVLSGGSGEDEIMTEAEMMHRCLVMLEVPPAQLRMEDKATSTWENLKYAVDLIEAETGVRPTKVGVLSSEYHLFRAELLAKEQGITVVGIPAATSSLGQRINHFMREVAGVWHYLLLGSRYE